MAYKSRKARRAAGGKAEGPEFQYNAKGAPEEKSEHAKSDGFKRGGGMKRAHGGHVEGEKARHHMGKRARGGHVETKAEERKEEHRARGGSIGKRTHGGAMKMGGSPYSAAHSASGPGNGKGSPGEQAPEVG